MSILGGGLCPTRRPNQHFGWNPELFLKATDPDLALVILTVRADPVDLVPNWVQDFAGQGVDVMSALRDCGSAGRPVHAIVWRRRRAVSARWLVVSTMGTVVRPLTEPPHPTDRAGASPHS